MGDRSFASFSEAADEAGMSRIYGGIHFNFDNTVGLASGRALGSYVFSTQLQAIPEVPASWLVGGFALISMIARSRRSRQVK